MGAVPLSYESPLEAADGEEKAVIEVHAFFSGSRRISWGTLRLIARQGVTPIAHSARLVAAAEVTPDGRWDFLRIST